VLAALPLVVVSIVHLVMPLVILPRLDHAFLAESRWGSTSIATVGGVRSVIVALAAGMLTIVIVGWRRLPAFTGRWR
jgi:hypothetical protein